MKEDTTEWQGWYRVNPTLASIRRIFLIPAAGRSPETPSRSWPFPSAHSKGHAIEFGNLKSTIGRKSPRIFSYGRAFCVLEGDRIGFWGSANSLLWMQPTSGMWLLPFLWSPSETDLFEFLTKFDVSTQQLRNNQLLLWTTSLAEIFSIPNENIPAIGLMSRSISKHISGGKQVIQKKTDFCQRKCWGCFLFKVKMTSPPSGPHSLNWIWEFSQLWNPQIRSKQCPTLAATHIPQFPDRFSRKQYLLMLWESSPFLAIVTNSRFR